MFLSALLLTCATQAPFLVADINRQPAPGVSSMPRRFSASGPGGVLFTAETDAQGVELWRSDGTPTGTRLVADIHPGVGSSFPELMVWAGSTAFFAADDGLHGAELWATDGTQAGTRLVKDIAPGADRSWITEIVAAGAGVFLVADDGVRGSELWFSDGSAAGTRMVADIAAGPAPSGPFSLQAFGAGVAFRAWTPAHDYELWVSDGTTAGTRMVLDVDPGSGPGCVGRLVVTGNRIFFTGLERTGGEEPWWSDGTAAGTKRIVDLNPGGNGSAPNGAVVHGGAVFFTAFTPQHGLELWRTDGTAAGTTLVVDAVVGAASSEASALLATRVGLLFFARDAVAGWWLWRTDGVTATRLTLLTATTGYILIPAAEVGGGAVLLADGLVLTDGTASGTRVVARPPQLLAEGSHSVGIDRLGNLLFAAGDDATGIEVWHSDATASGTGLLVDLRQHPGATASAWPDDLTPLPGRMVFLADDGVHGREVWVTDGSRAGTALVRDVRPGSEGSTVAADGPGIVAVGHQALFVAEDGVHGPELWRTDGRAAGTVLVRDLVPGWLGANPRELHALDHGRVVFAARRDTANDYELFVSDGSAAGTQLVADLRTGAVGSHPRAFHRLGASAIFTANGDAGDGLWRTDGTATGTTLLRLLGLGLQYRPLAVVRDRLYFAALGNGAGVELWSTDGTPGGTALVADVNPGPESSLPTLGVACGDRLVFSTTPTLFELDIWSTDGTAAGTRQLLALPRGRNDVIGHSLAVASDRVVVFAETMRGLELWGLDDGSSPPTLLQSLSAHQHVGMVKVGTRRVFAIARHSDGAIGWSTDGTLAGTRLVLDRRGSGEPLGVLAGGLLLFRDRDPQFGAELWAYEMSVPACGGWVGDAARLASRPPIRCSAA